MSEETLPGRCISDIEFGEDHAWDDRVIPLKEVKRMVAKLEMFSKATKKLLRSKSKPMGLSEFSLVMDELADALKAATELQ